MKLTELLLSWQHYKIKQTSLQISIDWVCTNLQGDKIEVIATKIGKELKNQYKEKKRHINNKTIEILRKLGEKKTNRLQKMTAL